MRGERLRYLRVEAGHSQESLAQTLGIGQKQIWRYENGETEPDGETVALIARALNVSADYLLGLSDEIRPLFREGDLSPKEVEVISSWRSGKHLQAIKVIAGDE